MNVMLSSVDALLAREVAVALRGTGFDPPLGSYRRPRFGRQALAGSTVLTAINTGVVQRKDFVRGSQGGARG